MIKMPSLKDKERILKAASEKKEKTYERAPISLAADFSTETLQDRREWQEILQVMESKGLQPRLLYPARFSIKMEGKRRSFPDKKSLKEYTSTKLALHDMLKGSYKKRKEKNERGTQVQRGGNEFHCWIIL